MMIYSLVTFYRVQAKISIAINNTAKEISQYTYVYGLTGVKDSLDGIYEDAAEDREKIDELVGDAGEAFNAIQTIGNDAKEKIDDFSNISSVDDLATIGDRINEMQDEAIENGEKVEDSYNKLKDDLEALANNPKDLIFSLARILSTEGLTYAQSNFVAAPISKGLVKKHLKRSINDNHEDFLRSMQVLPGSDGTYLNGLDFTDSLLFPKGSNKIFVIVKYKVKVLKFLPIDIEIPITQSAVTNGWLTGDGKKIPKPPNPEEPEEQEEKIVYITDHASVYHTSKECTYITKLCKKIAVTDLEKARNSKGKKYSACESCMQGVDLSSLDSVVITTTGDRYHLESCGYAYPSCYEVKLSEIALRMCSRCQKREGDN